MTKLTKKRKAALARYDQGTLYSLADAVGIVKEISDAKFDPSVDIDIRLGVDPRKANQMVRGTVALPHGTGKTLRVLVLCTPDKEDEAKQAGADFIVSPVCEPSLVRSMVASGLLTMAGALTPTEVLQTYNLGADVIKIFPGSLGGPAYLKALRGPFPHIPMMPTGGVSQDNIAEWLAAGAVAVGAATGSAPPPSTATTARSPTPTSTSGGSSRGCGGTGRPPSSS